MSLAVLLSGLSVFPVVLRCEGMATAPRPTPFSDAGAMFADGEIGFDPRLTSLVGAAGAKGEWDGAAWQMKGELPDRGKLALSLALADKDKGTFILDWKAVEAAGAVRTSGVGKCVIVDPSKKESGK